MKLNSDILRKLDIAFENATNFPPDHGWYQSNGNVPFMTYDPNSEKAFLNLDLQNVIIVNENTNFILRLSRSVPSDKRVLFLKYLSKKVLDGNNMETQTATHALYLLKGFNILSTSLKKLSNLHHSNLRVWAFLSSLSLCLRLKGNLVSQSFLEKLRYWIRETKQGGNRFGSLVLPYRNTNLEVCKAFDFFDKTVCAINFDKELKNLEAIYNPELNQDSDRLKKEISKYNFPKELSLALDEVDKKLTNEFSETAYKEGMDHLRAMTEKLFFHIARKTNEKEAKLRGIDGKDSEKFSKLLRDTGFLDGDHTMLISAVRHFISNKGAHSLKSSFEDLRISRNIVIELGLYLMKRLEEYC